MTTANETDDQRQQIAARLREAREYVGLSQDEVAASLGLSRPAITLIESANRRLEAVELAKLARLYGKSSEYLLNGDESAEVKSNLEFFARTMKDLTSSDLAEVARFAAFLKQSKSHSGKDR
jgi:transcriptional regulator with XRE-family HTH domain